MRCKACNKVMDTPKNWLSETEPEDDMCSACVKSGETDWDTREFAFGYRVYSGVTLKTPDYDKVDKKAATIHAYYEEYQ